MDWWVTIFMVFNVGTEIPLEKKIMAHYDSIPICIKLIIDE